MHIWRMLLLSELQKAEATEMMAAYATGSPVPAPFNFQDKVANHDLDAKGLRLFCEPKGSDAEFALKAVDRLGLSARGYHRVLKAARTIADLEQSEKISVPYLMEALSYRALFK